jgi:hypothetical protein
MLPSLAHHLASLHDQLLQFQPPPVPHIEQLHRLLSYAPLGPNLTLQLYRTDELPSSPWIIHPLESSPGPLLNPANAALLHLPALRPYWATRLRSNILSSLRLHLPPAWLIDLSLLPPSTTLARLPIHQWHQLSSLREKNHCFAIHYPNQTPIHLSPDQPATDWQHHTTQLLERANTGVPILLQQLPHPGNHSQTLDYLHTEDRWSQLPSTP